MFKDYDVVIAKRKLAENILPGTRGTILLTLDKSLKVFEIEFVDDFGESIGSLSVHEEDICRDDKCC